MLQQTVGFLPLIHFQKTSVPVVLETIQSFGSKLYFALAKRLIYRRRQRRKTRQTAYAIETSQAPSRLSLSPLPPSFSDRFE